MTTFTAFTTLASQGDADALALALEALDPAPIGVGTFEIEDGSGRWEIGGYFTDAPDIAGLAILASVHGAADFAVSKLDDRDWVAQVRRELTPVHAGRFVVYGGHDAERIAINAIGLRIEAAMAFGTGHHGTTLGCLRALSALCKSGFLPTRIADIGSGTGVLAMAAAKVFPGLVLATDIDPVAVATARANCVANALGSRIRCRQSVGFQSEDVRRSGPFDLVFANILANPLKLMAYDMAINTRVGARIILSGILNRQAASVIQVYSGHGFRLESHQRIGEWSTLTMARSDRLPKKTPPERPTASLI